MTPQFVEIPFPAKTLKDRLILTGYTAQNAKDVLLAYTSKMLKRTLDIGEIQEWQEVYEWIYSQDKGTCTDCKTSVGFCVNCADNLSKKDIKECTTCGKLKKSNPTPDGDEVCPDCGDREMMDYELDTDTATDDEIKEVKEFAREDFDHGNLNNR